MKQQENEKLSDKAFSRLLLTSIFGVLLCIVCLCSATWAWFSTGIKSSENTIETGEGSLRVTVTKDDKTINCVDVEQALPKGEYVVTMVLPENSASGYCVIVANGKEYLSPYIYKEDATKSISFTVSLTEETTLCIKTHWGIYSAKSADVEVDGTLSLTRDEPQ